MANHAILVFENNRPKRRESSSNTFDFQSIKIGASGLEISETAGAFNFNSINVVSAGSFNGVTVEAHAARHIIGGADIIDGDNVELTIANPSALSNYTPTTTGTGGLAASALALAAHLKGIDNAIGTKLSLSGGTMTGSINMGGNSITNLADPVSPQDAVTKFYADSIAAGLDPKESVRMASTADVGGTYGPTGGTAGSGAFTGVNFTASGTWDGLTGTNGAVTLAVNDRVVLWNQTDAKQNGIFKITTAGASGAMERASDQDGTPANEVSGGNFTYIENGTLYESAGLVLQGDGVLTLNTDNLVWVQFSGAGQLIAGAGLLKTGNQLDVELATDPALEFDAGGVGGKLRVKVKSGGGVTRDSNGLSVNTSDITAALAGNGLVANGAAIDVNPGDGVALVSDKVVVNLATNPGLEFATGALRVKVKAAGGITRDSNGLYVNTSDITAALAGDGLVANGAAIDVNPGDGVALVSDKVVVSLATDPGLEFATGSLRVKVKAAGGITRDAAGLSVNTSDITAALAGNGLVANGAALDVNPGDGIALVSDKVVVNLATDPGLEFATGALRVKVKASGSLTRDASGLSFDAANAAGDGLVASSTHVLAVNPGDGIALVSDKVVVSLATDPGLEFATGALRVKVKVAGGILRDSGGIYVDTSAFAATLAGNGLIDNGSAIDVNPGDGIALLSDKVIVNLATDPGLEFATGALRVKVKAAGGITRDSNGLSVNTSDITSALAGNGLVANGAAIDVNPGDGIALVSDKVVVNLATDPGLEFATGALRVKVKAAGSITRDASGLSFDAANAAGDGLVAASAHVLAVNPGDGVALVSDKVVVNLATDPGLEFATGALRVKVKAAGGITRDSNGLSVNTSDITAALAGDGLVANGAAIDVNPGDGIALISDKVIVNLATDPGLEFATGALRVKVKAAGSLTRDASGLSFDAANAAGDGLVAASAHVLAVNPGDGVALVSDKVVVNLATDPGLEFATGALRVKVKTAGGILRDSGGIYVDTSAFAATLAGNGLIDNGSAIDVNPGDGIALLSDKVIVNLATDPGLEFNTGALRVKVKAAGGITRDSNGLSVNTSDITSALAGNGLVANGAALDVQVGDGIQLVSDEVRAKYTEALTNDFASSVTSGQVVYVKSNGNVDLAQANVTDLNTNALGIVADASIATTASGQVFIRRGAVVSGFSGMTPGKKQYVSRATAGALTESLAGFVAGEFVYCVGRALSATKLVYDPQFELEF